MKKTAFAFALAFTLTSCSRYIITGTDINTGQPVTVYTRQISPAWCDTLITTEGIIITNYKIIEK